MSDLKTFSVFVGGSEVHDFLLTEQAAWQVANERIDGGYTDVAVITHHDGRERFVNPDLSNFDIEFEPSTSRQARIAELEELSVTDLAEMIYELENGEVVIEVTNGVAEATRTPDGITVLILDNDLQEQ